VTLTTPDDAGGSTAGVVRKWSDLSSEELGAAARDPRTVVLMPIGAVEQHGRHLPVDVDIHLASAVCDAVAARSADVLLAPPVPWGFSASHEAFAGALSLTGDTYLGLLRDLAASVLRSGFRTLLFVNGHNGNIWIAGQVAAEIAPRSDAFVGVVTYFDLTLDVFAAERRTPIGGEGHAGELETALELHLRPGRVGDDRDARPVHRHTEFGFADLAQRGNIVAGFNLERDYAEGVIGDPGPATGALGARLFDTAVERLTTIAGQLAERPETAR
jgi:creatinine amidohydrolase